MFQCKSLFGLAAFSSLGFLAFFALSFFSAAASAQSFEQTMIDYVSAIETHQESILSHTIGIGTYVDNVETYLIDVGNDVAAIKPKVADITVDVDQMATSLGRSLGTDVGTIATYSHSINTSVLSCVASLQQLTTDVAAIKTSLTTGQRITLHDLQTQVGYITSRLDSVVSSLDDIADFDLVDPADVFAIRTNVASLLSELQSLRSYDLAPMKVDLSNISGYASNIESDVGQVEQYWLPEIVDRLDLLLSASNSASASPVTITNVVNLDANVWEPFWAWTNVFLQMAINVPDTDIENHFADWLDPNGYYVWPNYWGDREPLNDWIPSLPSFMSVTFGGLYDNSYLDTWVWESLFSPHRSTGDIEDVYANWYWWMAEGVRRQLQSLGQATNLLSRVSDGLDQIHTINYEILQSVKQFSSVSNVVTSEEYTSETNELVSSYPGFQDDDSEYPSDYSTNDLPHGAFYSQMETVVSPEFESKKDDITASLSPTWDVQGQGLFRVKSDELSTALSSFGLTPPAHVGTFEVDLNSQAGHTYDSILDMIADPIKNIYDLFKYLFCILVVYGEIRYYLSGGKTK